ncbi:MAG: hypothetical protein IKK83_05040 [Clostridia bacterium]|nr:hypothetical protein [Clostridia bacterium]
MSIPVKFSDCSAVTGATFNGHGDILTVNSFDSAVYNNTSKCDLCTCRPYSFISAHCSCILAISGGCSNRVYVLNECLEETGGICLRGGNGPLLTVYLTEDCGMVLTYRNAVYLADENGSISETLATASCEDGEFIAAAPTDTGMLYAVSENGAQYILHRSPCGNDSCYIPVGIMFKSFVYGNDGTVYGLFAKGYPYRYLVPVLVNGALQCPSASCFGTRLCLE